MVSHKEAPNQKQSVNDDALGKKGKKGEEQERKKGEEEERKGLVAETPERLCFLTLHSFTLPNEMSNDRRPDAGPTSNGSGGV